MACKIADVNKKGIEITPIGASSFHATIFEELAATFCSYHLLVEPLVFPWLRNFSSSFDARSYHVCWESQFPQDKFIMFKWLGPRLTFLCLRRGRKDVNFEVTANRRYCSPDFA